MATQAKCVGLTNTKAARCYLCGSPNLTLIADIRRKPRGETDFGIPPDNYRRFIYQCQNCSVYCNIHDYITQEFYTERYSQATYSRKIHDKYREIRNLPRERSDNKHRVERVASFIDRLGLPHEQVHVLDVGSGLGVFPAELKDLGFSCYCIDPDAAAIEHALQNVKVDGAHVGTLDDFESEQKFDLISFNKILEHIKEPVQYLKKAHGFLISRGIVYIELPDGDSALEHGDAIDREEFYIEHFTIFNKASLIFLAQHAGFDCLEVENIHEPSDKFTVYGFLKPRVG